MDLLTQLADENKGYDPRQPRDDLGRWSDGPTERGKISIGHAIHVAKHEGITEDHHHESIRAGIESGRLNTREKVLQHIDAIHDSRRTGTQAPPKVDASTKQRIDNIADRYNITGMARETLHDEIPREKHLEKRVEEVGIIATAAAVADGASKVGLDHVLEAIAVVNHPDGFAGYKKRKIAEAEDANNQRVSEGLSPRPDQEVTRLNAIDRHVDTVRRSEVRQTRESVQSQHQANAAYRQAAFGAVQRGLGYARPRKSDEDDDMNDTQVAFGAEIKSLGEEDGKARIGGYLVYFGGPADTDLVGDYFTPNTYFGARKGDGADTMIHHGLPLKANMPELDWTRDYLLAPLKTSVDTIGIFAETVCDLANAHEAKIHDLVKAGKLKWSSGAASHTVRRRDGAKAGEITRWPIIEGSLTPTPCQGTGTGVMSLKALILDEAEELKWDESQHPRDDNGRFGSGGGGASSSIARVEQGGDGKRNIHITSGRLDALAFQYGVREGSAAHGLLHQALEAGHIESAADVHNILSDSAKQGHGAFNVEEAIHEHGKNNAHEFEGDVGTGTSRLTPSSLRTTLGLKGIKPNGVAAGVIHEAVSQGHIRNARDLNNVLRASENGSDINTLHTAINRHGNGKNADGRFRSSLLGGRKSWDEVPFEERAPSIKSFLEDPATFELTAPEDEQTDGDNTKSFDWELEMALAQNEMMDSRFITTGLSA